MLAARQVARMLGTCRSASNSRPEIQTFRARAFDLALALALLMPDGTVTATSPDKTQVLHSHGPPAQAA
jgi:hypothetical protein